MSSGQPNPRSENDKGPKRMLAAGPNIRNGFLPTASDNLPPILKVSIFTHMSSTRWGPSYPFIRPFIGVHNSMFRRDALPETNSSHLKDGIPKGKESSNHPFSGSYVLVSGRLYNIVFIVVYLLEGFQYMVYPWIDVEVDYNTCLHNTWTNHINLL